MSDLRQHLSNSRVSVDVDDQVGVLYVGYLQKCIDLLHTLVTSIGGQFAFISMLCLTVVYLVLLSS